MLLVNHGKRCPRCAKNGQPRKASDGDCPLFGSKSAKEVLKGDPEIEQDSQVKQDDHDSLCKQDGSEEDWVSAVKQDPGAGHSAVKYDANIENCGMAPIKAETGTDSEYKRQKQKDGTSFNQALPNARRSSRSTRYQAKKECDEDAHDNQVAVKAEADS